jgi:hypothetical protein
MSTKWEISMPCRACSRQGDGEERWARTGRGGELRTGRGCEGVRGSIDLIARLHLYGTHAISSAMFIDNLCIAPFRDDILLAHQFLEAVLNSPEQLRGPRGRLAEVLLCAAEF